MIDTGSYTAIWSPPLMNTKWDSDIQPVTVTSKQIRLFTNFMNRLQRYIFTELQMAS